MGCDYYHEAVLEGECISDESGELEIKVDVYGGDGKIVETQTLSVEVPVGGRVYIENNPETPPIWAR